MSRFLIQSRTELTSKGETGAVLLAGGPILAAASYWWYAHTLAANLAAAARLDPFPEWVPALAIVASIGTTSIGLVMLLTGRSMTHEVEVLQSRSGN